MALEEASGETSQFSASDDQALSLARDLVSELSAKNEFVDLSGMSVQCGDCFQAFVGMPEAIQHQRDLGHANFRQVTRQ